MPNVQSTGQPTSVPTHNPQELFDDFGRFYRFMVKPLERESTNPSSELPSVMIGYPDALTAKLAFSQQSYTARKAQGMQDFRKALAPIAKSTIDNIIDKCAHVLKRVKERAVKVINNVYRYTGLESVVNGFKERFNPKADLIHARWNAHRREDLLGQIKAFQSIWGQQLPIQPKTTVNTRCAGFSNYDDVNAKLESDIDANKESVNRKVRMLRAIEIIEQERADKDFMHRLNFIENRNAEELANARNNAAVAVPGDLIDLDGAAAFDFEPEQVTAKMQRAKAALDAKMSERAEQQHQKNRQAMARKQIKTDMAKAAGLLGARMSKRAAQQHQRNSQAIAKKQITTDMAKAAGLLGAINGWEVFE